MRKAEYPNVGGGPDVPGPDEVHCITCGWLASQHFTDPADPRDSYGLCPPEIVLGLPVRFDFNLTLARRERPPTGAKRAPFEDALQRKIWEPRWPHSPGRHDLRDGIIVGQRSLADGEITWGSYDEPTVFYPKVRFRAYLVAYNLRRTPVLLKPESLIFKEPADV